MKKLLYFAASALSLGIIFGAGWAAGTGKVVPEIPATKINLPGQRVFDETVPPDDEILKERGKDGKCGDGDETEKRIKFKIPAPADFRDKFTKLPYFD